MVQLFSKLGSTKISSYIMNAAGPKDETLPELQIIGKSRSACITMKSCTLEAREGNPFPRYAFTASPYGSLSTSGLPNLGYREYINIASALKTEFPDKPIIVSVAGLDIYEFPILVSAFQISEADIIEINLHSCPKKRGLPQLVFDSVKLEEVLSLIKDTGSKPVGLKLPPIFDLEYIEELSVLFRKYKITYVASLSSLSPALIIDSETESVLIKPKSGVGGLGGDYVKPIALANVNAFFKALNGEVSVVGVGGVRSGTDAFEFLLAGADAVQVGTAFYEEGPGCFERIDKELNVIMDRKGYNSIADAKGKLRLLN